DAQRDRRPVGTVACRQCAGPDPPVGNAVEDRGALDPRPRRDRAAPAPQGCGRSAWGADIGTRKVLDAGGRLRGCTLAWGGGRAPAALNSSSQRGRRPTLLSLLRAVI